MPSESRPSRVVVVDGVRTPFSKRNTAYRKLTAVELGTLCVAELVHRSGLSPALIDRVVYGHVVPTPDTINIARDVSLRAGLPATVDAVSVSRACATGYQAIVDGAMAISAGLVRCVIAGGADSVSTAPLSISDRLADALRHESMRDRARAFAGVRPHDLAPRAPSLTEPATGMTMGESAEKMAKENRIDRHDQDELAHRSHENATRAWRDGRMAGEVMQVFVPPDYEHTVNADDTVRPDSQLERYAELAPVFDRDHGSITAGNSSPLTDGASAVLLMDHDLAREHGLEPLGVIEAHAFTAVDPNDQLLIGPVDAIPLALERAGRRLADMELVDLHEAFAAQVLSVMQKLEQRGVGTIDVDRLNVGGGSIALGHPFAATGGRQITQTLNELRRRGGGRGLISACAAGGLAAAIVVESL